MTPERAGHKILIVASDPLLAALVGTLVETKRYVPAFPTPNEAPDVALERVKPLAAILLDAGDATAESDLFVSRVRRMSARVLVFGSTELLRRREEWIARHALPAFTLPQELALLEEALEALIPDAKRPRAEAERRGNTERRPDGTLVFTDASGVRWSVYDRRGPDRRSSVDRRFVNDAGEVRHCALTAEEAGLTTPTILSEQLGRASLVAND